MKEIPCIRLNIIDTLLKECKKSNHCHKHAAALVSNNKILCSAHNNQDGHAEINCIQKLPPKSKLKSPCTLYIIRSNNNETIVNSKPCLALYKVHQKFKYKPDSLFD